MIVPSFFGFNIDIEKVTENVETGPEPTAQSVFVTLYHWDIAHEGLSAHGTSESYDQAIVDAVLAIKPETMSLRAYLVRLVSLTLNDVTTHGDSYIPNADELVRLAAQSKYWSDEERDETIKAVAKYMFKPWVPELVSDIFGLLDPEVAQ